MKDTSLLSLFDREVTKMQKRNVKQIRRNGEFQKEISLIIRSGIKDPRISPMTSVTDVDITPDLKYAKVYISVLGTEEDKKNTLLGLKNAEGYIRTQLAKTVNLRNTPQLKFVADDTIAYGAHMSQLIDEVMEQEKKKEEAQEAARPEEE